MVRRGAWAPEVATGEAMQAARWYRVWLSADPATGRVLVGQQRLGGAAVTATTQAPGMTLPSGGCVMLAAENAAAPRHHFTGKLEDPAIIPGFVEAWPRSRCDAGRVGAGSAGWMGFFTGHRQRDDP